MKKRVFISFLFIFICAVSTFSIAQNYPCNDQQGISFHGNSHQGNSHQGNNHQGNSHQGNNHQGNNYHGGDFPNGNHPGGNHPGGNHPGGGGTPEPVTMMLIAGGAGAAFVSKKFLGKK